MKEGYSRVQWSQQLEETLWALPSMDLTNSKNFMMAFQSTLQCMVL